MIANPVDAEDFAYNLAQVHDLAYPTQVALEAALNLLETAKDVADRANILSELMDEFSRHEGM